MSNETGNYTFNNLASGIYRVEGELVGFTKFGREGVEVNVNTTVRVDIGLNIGELSESVLVTGEAPMLQTDRTDTGRIIQSEQITQMPLGFNRNFQGLLDHGAGRVASLPPAFGVLQLAGQPLEQHQRPVAAIQQRPAGRRRQQR